MVAYEWFFTSVSEFVSLQMSFSYKLLVALIAHKWTLSSVSPHVSLQIACLGEFLKTLFEWTDKNFLLILGSFDWFNLSYKRIRSVLIYSGIHDARLTPWNWLKLFRYLFENEPDWGVGLPAYGDLL